MLSIIVDNGEISDRRTSLFSWQETPYWDTEDEMVDNGLKTDMSHM